MKRFTYGAIFAFALVPFVLLSQSCDGPVANEGSGDQATIDVVGVTTGVEEMSTFIDICRPSGSQTPAASSPARTGPPKLLARLLEIRRARGVLGMVRASALSTTAPADKLGDCGGRATYVSYEHANGTTTATYEYQDYCNVDSETGDRITLDGRLSFTEHGTPGDYGPIISGVDAESSDGISETTRSSGGQLLSSRLVKFDEFQQTNGVPGGSPTSGNPDRITVKELSSGNQQNGKTYRQTDFSMTDYFTSSGEERTTFSGKGYRSNGDFYTYSTTSPISTDSDGDFTGGSITFTGAENSTAVVTIVPGSVLQGTLTVNGETVTNVPVCR